MPASERPDDDERPARRRTLRRLVGAGMLGFALLGGLGATALEGVAVDWFGDGSLDARLDAYGTEVVATTITSDAEYGRWIVSYEYFWVTALDVGYQRVSEELGSTLRFGTLVDIEAVGDSPDAEIYRGGSRIKGTRREPFAWVTRGLVATRVPRLVLAVVLGGLGLWLVVRRGDSD